MRNRKKTRLYSAIYILTTGEKRELEFNQLHAEFQHFSVERGTQLDHLRGFLPTRQRRCGKVLFLVVSVCL